MRSIIKLYAFLFLCCGAAGLSASDQPNVVVVLTDDQGWGDLSLHGNTNLRTPNLDRLAASGASFRQFFVCPVCAPTRAEFLTGRYHPRSGVRGVTSGGERLDLQAATVADLFSDAGYKTAAFGKWHNGMQYPYHPCGRGFDEFYGYCSGHWGDYFSPQLEHNGKLVQGQGYLVDDFSNRAMNFIEQHREDSFFVYLAMPTPHAPMQVPDSYWDADRGLPMRARSEDQEDLQFTRAALSMVECIDDNVGRLLAKIEELQLSENTIVVFFCDNGPNSYRWNGDMKGRKGSTDEGGVRSPLFVSWPGKIAANQQIEELGAAIDLLPSLCDLAEVPVPKQIELDGVSWKSRWLGERATMPDRMIFSHWNDKVSVRTGRYRLDHRGRLFDLLNDPGQRRPVGERESSPAAGQSTGGEPSEAEVDYRTTARELQQAVATWRTEMQLPLAEDTRPFVIGHPDFEWTQLPARDARAYGSIIRSAKAPNCSYFSNWRSTEDSIRWDVEVLAAGEFEVQMYYACPASCVGSRIELQLLGESLEATIDQPNDPPAVGAEHDRVVRTTQSYMKDFKPLNFGRIRLEPGRGELVLRALAKQGSDSLEMRLLMFRRHRSE